MNHLKFLDGSAGPDAATPGAMIPNATTADAPAVDMNSLILPNSDDARRETARVLQLRDVHRAVAELRRGIPVILDCPEKLVLLAAETAGATGLAEFGALSSGQNVLLLAPVRAAAVLRRPVGPETVTIALQVPAQLLDPAALRSMADPTFEQMLPEDPVLSAWSPAASGAALALAKLGRLLPAVLAAPLGEAAPAVAQERRILSVSAEHILAYPSAMAAGVVRVAEAVVPLEGAPDARVVAFRAPDAGIEHLAILIGRPENDEAPITRLHSECFTGDLLGSLRCDCGPQLRGAIARMAEAGSGVLLYLAQEGRGIGLVNKLRAYTMQDRGMDTLDANRALGWGADERNFMVAATMLEALGISEIRLLTNNPDKVAAMEACGIRVARREQHAFAPNGVNDSYLATKAARFGHLLG
jgi:GTP cyclohydrolase II